MKTALEQPVYVQVESDLPVHAQVLPPILAPPPPPLAINPAPILQPTPAPATTPARKQKPYHYPSLLTLPSKTAIPINRSDSQFLEYSFLPTSSLKGNALFNALSLLHPTAKTTVS